jgi:glucan biosynthesis protein C
MLPNPSSPSRRHDLDWLRVIAFGLLIFYHVGMFYVTWGWHVKSDHASPALEPAMALLNPWRLALLFFISGVALRFAIDAKGPGRISRERLSRLLVPLAFGMLVVVVPQAYLELRFKGEIEPGILGFYPFYLGLGDSDFSIIVPTWNHLWYVAYALVYSLLVAAMLPLLRRAGDAFGDGADTTLRSFPAAILLIAVPFVAYALLLNPRFPTTHAMVDDWATHANYLTMMLVGWFAARSATFWSAIDRTWKATALLALPLGAAIVVARLNMADLRQVDGFLEAIGVVRAAYAWLVIVALLGLARRFLSWTSPRLTYLTEAVFPWYILHQTIIVMGGYATIGSGLPLWLEATLIVSVTVGGCVVLHEFVIRRSNWLRPLFGLKANRRVEAATPFAIAKKPV